MPEIRVCPIRFEILNLLLSNALLVALAHVADHATFVVIRDVFCNYCIPREQLIVHKLIRLFLLRLKGVARFYSMILSDVYSAKFRGFHG